MEKPGILKQMAYCIKIAPKYLVNIYTNWASSRENVSSGVSDQARHKTVLLSYRD